MERIVIAVLVVLLLALGAFFILDRGSSTDLNPPTETSGQTAPQTPAPSQPKPLACNHKVTASASNRTPTQNSDVTITVGVHEKDGQPVPGANVTTIWKYKTTESQESGATNSSGFAYLKRSIGRATKGFTVVVEALVNFKNCSYKAATSFTPQ